MHPALLVPANECDPFFQTHCRNFICFRTGVHKIFQKSISHLETLGARWVTIIKFHTKNPQISGAQYFEHNQYGFCFFPYTGKCVPVYVQMSRKRQKTVAFSDQSRIVGSKYGTCFMSPIWRPEFRTCLLRSQKICCALL